MQEVLFGKINGMLLSLKSLCFIAFLSFGFALQQTNTIGGLKFHGSEQSIDRRTSYNVFGDKTVEFKHNFYLDFSLSLYPDTEIGYIFRIKNKDSNKIYNLFYNGEGHDLVFILNEEGTNNLIIAEMEREELLDMHWFHVKVNFNLKTKIINLTIHDQTFSTENKNLPDKYSPIILFGKSDHIIDVPSFAIKDISVGNKESYFFPLKESKGDKVNEANDKLIGSVTNPEWLMNDAYHWKYKDGFKSTSVAGANYNPKGKEILYYNQDSILLYNVRSGSTRLKIFEEKCPIQLKLGTNVIDTARNRLIAYEVYYDIPYIGPTVAILDLNTYEWSVENHDQLPTQLHHHGSYVDFSKESFTIFGGFGNMRYSKNFFEYDLENSSWDVLDGFTGDQISPRYFSALGFLEDTNSIYIFGGMGNESGEQTVGRRYYYDLYKIDLTKKHVTKLWEIPWENDNMVPVRGMVLLDDSHFYTLCYPEHFSESSLRLYRFSLKDGNYEILGDSIPIYSDKINTNANLYFDNSLNNLYAVIQEFEDDISSELKFYSLDFPPVTAKELTSYDRNVNHYLIVKWVVAILLALLLFYIVFRKFRNKSINAEYKGFADTSIELSTPEKKLRPNSIYLFGEFTVRDRYNKDITHLFSSQLKQILCLIIQYSVAGNGITSQNLSNILWPDKPAYKVKNSRGVTIKNLRTAMSELDGIELVYERGHFKITKSEQLYCDYYACIQLITSPELSSSRYELIEILDRGKFLQLSDHPLFDSLKEEMEKVLEPYLLVELGKSYSESHFQETISLAEAIFNIDPLNETALNFQIKAFQKLRMVDEARRKFEFFALNYKKIMGTEYPHVFKV